MGGEVVVWTMVGLFALLIVVIVLLGLFYPGSGAAQLDWRPTRSPETEAQNEVDDLTQMLEATNAKRAARGLPALDQTAIDTRLREDAELRASLRPDESVEEERRQLEQAREARRRMREERENG